LFGLWHRLFHKERGASQFKIESAFFEFLVFFRVKAEQLRRPVATGHPGFPEGCESAKTQHLFAEIPLVQGGGQNPPRKAAGVRTG
jgi:hypothetical protein